MHASICDILLDCFQNSVEADADCIKLTWNEESHLVVVIIEDNGRGMTADVLKRCQDPWFTDGVKHKNRKVGLGLPFLYQMIEMTDGTIDIQSTPGKGTLLKFSFNPGHLDTPPIGDLAGTLVSALLFDGDYEVIFKRRCVLESSEIREYEWSRNDLQDILGDFGLISSLSLLKSFLESQEDYIKE